MDAKLDVGNLASTTSNDDLRQLFTQAGAVASVVMIKDRDTGAVDRPRGDHDGDPRRYPQSDQHVRRLPPG